MTSEYLLSITNKNKAVFTVRPVWVTNGRRSAVIAMLGSSLRMLQFRLGMDGVAVARNKQACPSHPHVLESDRTPAFLLLLLLLLLLVASAAGASAAAAAAAAAAATALRTAGWSCFIFYSNSFAKAIWWWMLYRTLRKVTCTNMRKKHVRRDSKICCCCCCRFWCGAPTTDERLHAPVLHDASQIDYCRY